MIVEIKVFLEGLNNDGNDEKNKGDTKHTKNGVRISGALNDVSPKSRFTLVLSFHYPTYIAIIFTFSWSFYTKTHLVLFLLFSTHIICLSILIFLFHSIVFFLLIISFSLSLFLV